MPGGTPVLDFPLWTTIAGLAAEAGNESLDLTVFAQYGVLGIITALLIIFAKGAYQREKDRADRLETENQRLYQLMLDRVIPALTSAAQAAEESSELLSAIQREREMANLVNIRRSTRRPPSSDGGSQ